YKSAAIVPTIKAVQSDFEKCQSFLDKVNIPIRKQITAVNAVTQRPGPPSSACWASAAMVVTNPQSSHEKGCGCIPSFLIVSRIYIAYAGMLIRTDKVPKNSFKFVTLAIMHSAQV